jgi:hypothetical protein
LVWLKVLFAPTVIQILPKVQKQQQHGVLQMFITRKIVKGKKDFDSFPTYYHFPVHMYGL